MNKRSKRTVKSTHQSADGGLPLTGLEPFDPPQPNLLILIVAVGLFVVWLGFLIWLALRSF